MTKGSDDSVTECSVWKRLDYTFSHANAIQYVLIYIALSQQDRKIKQQMTVLPNGTVVETDDTNS